ncbi:hypothetical protein [Mycobacteroides abscessus]|uniref:hypothetical protein n=1 Tax=Mycobacteroides abscessus TaxID=36809 RepID=UPI00189655F2|nr:hypothetical protein [Mycobacteroides abscessus]MBN7478839.1 hypothetical protein [Mycobacteroides abscessus subsp. abscessus]MCA4716555.1 hypothetical protein [Mycobacteroides abscessus]
MDKLEIWDGRLAFAVDDAGIVREVDPSAAAAELAVASPLGCCCACRLLCDFGLEFLCLLGVFDSLAAPAVFVFGISVGVARAARG